MTNSGNALIVLGGGSFRPAPRFWSANFCGVRVPGLPPIPGGAADTSLVLSWLTDRYSAADRQRIYAVWRERDYTHVVVSWPDSRSVGKSPQDFANFCAELIANGFYPCPFLYSKDYDPSDVPAILAGLAPLLPLLHGLVPMVCIGWELSIRLTPTQVQQLIDAIAPGFVAARARVYVHLGARYFSFQQDGGIAADFWKLQVGKLTGILAQRDQNADDHDTLDWIHDCLERCAGHDFMPLEIIDGHPVDFVALELTAMAQFAGSMSEAQGDVIGRMCILAPPQSGPAGTVRVMGSGNGS